MAEGQGGAGAGAGAGAGGQGAQGAQGGGGAAPPAIDYSAVYGTLSPENKEIFDRKGFGKAGTNGGPIDINGVFEWARNAEKLVGTDHIPAPRLDNDEEFAKWPGHEKLGVPKDEKGYKLERPQMPDGVPYNDAAENALRVALRKAHIGQKQAELIFKELSAFHVGEATKLATTQAEAKTAMETELRTHFGAGLDVAMQRAKIALNYVAEKAGVKLERAIDGIASLTGDGAAAIKVMHWIGQQLGEDVIKGGQGAGFAAGPAAAKAEISNLMLNPDFTAAYYNRDHPGHADAVKRMNRLHEQAEAA